MVTGFGAVVWSLLLSYLGGTAPRPGLRRRGRAGKLGVAHRRGGWHRHCPQRIGQVRLHIARLVQASTDFGLEKSEPDELGGVRRGSGWPGKVRTFWPMVLGLPTVLPSSPGSIFTKPPARL